MLFREAREAGVTERLRLRNVKADDILLHPIVLPLLCSVIQKSSAGLKTGNRPVGLKRSGTCSLTLCYTAPYWLSPSMFVFWGGGIS